MEYDELLLSKRSYDQLRSGRIIVKVRICTDVRSLSVLYDMCCFFVKGDRSIDELPSMVSPQE